MHLIHILALLAPLIHPSTAQTSYAPPQDAPGPADPPPKEENPASPLYQNPEDSIYLEEKGYLLGYHVNDGCTNLKPTVFPGPLELGIRIGDEVCIPTADLVAFTIKSAMVEIKIGPYTTMSRHACKAKGYQSEKNCRKDRAGAWQEINKCYAPGPITFVKLMC